MSTDYSEDTLVEQPTIELFSELDYETANCFYEKVGTSDSTLGRETTAEVILIPKLRNALQKLNPDLPSDAIDLAIEALARDRSAMSLVQEKHQSLRSLAAGPTHTTAKRTYSPCSSKVPARHFRTSVCDAEPFRWPDQCNR